MKNFHCHCGNRVFFENTACQNCQRQLGFDPARLEVIALDVRGKAWSTEQLAANLENWMGDGRDVGFSIVARRAEIDVRGFRVEVERAQGMKLRYVTDHSAGLQRYDRVAQEYGGRTLAHGE